MKNEATFSDWKDLFLKETGQNADSARYGPEKELSIPVYIDTQNDYDTESYEDMAFGIRKVSHALISTPEGIRPWINQNLKQYNIVSHPSFFNNKARILDLKKAKEDPQILKKGIESFPKDDPPIGIIPSDDFLWNVGVVRGLQKFFRKNTHLLDSYPDILAYIPVSELEHPGDAQQLIPLSNKLLSVSVSGICSFIWDLEKITPWQKEHLHLLLNIPEILSRESRIYDYSDPITGSAFFEELSHRIMDFLNR